MSEVAQIVVGTLIGGLIGSVPVIGYILLKHYLWLRRFRREYRAEREQWFKEHQECCELDESYLSQLYG